MTRARFGYAVLLAASACGSRARATDVVPVSEDRHERPTSATSATVDGGTGDVGYVYVARRPLAIVALAESRELETALAIRVVDQLADVADTCLTNLGREGQLGAGALRIVLEWNDDGSLAGINRTFSPEKGALATGLLCVVHPAQTLVLAPLSAEEKRSRATRPMAEAARKRAMAIESTWGSSFGANPTDPTFPEKRPKPDPR